MRARGAQMSWGMKRPPAKQPAAAPVRRVATAKRRASNDALPFGHHRLAHELEVHQLELEIQNRTLQESQAALEESRARYAELYDYAPVGHLSVDRAGVVHELNIAAAALLGVERRDVINRPLRLFLTPGGRPVLDAHLRASWRSSRPLSAQIALHRPGADAIFVELLTVPPPAHAGAADRVSTLHCALVDVSERIRAEHVNRVKQDFLSVVSHELRSPLAPMKLWVQALRLGGMSETLRLQAIDALETCLSLQDATIEDLIDVAQGWQGTLRVDLQPMDLGAVVRAVVEAFAPSVAAKQIEVTFDVGPSPPWVLGDSIRLQQVVANLLSNALRFTREAGRIALGLEARGGQAVLTVSDDGEGIDAARLPHLFEPFHHGRDARVPPHHGGLGLGLSIVRELVTRHAGTVTAESAGVGRGSCFTVVLPRVEPGFPIAGR